jgi:hypothetical protein
MQEAKKEEAGTVMEETSEVTQDVRAEEAHTGSEEKAEELARKVDEINEQKTTR